MTTRLFKYPEETMSKFGTLPQLAATFGVRRDVIETWLVEIGLYTGNGTPTKKASTAKLCKVLNTGGSGVLVLWHRQRSIAALKAVGHSTAIEKQAKDALTSMIVTVRSVMEWGEIQELLIAAKVKEHGVEAKIV
jgi:hypothetical protein